MSNSIKPVNFENHQHLKVKSSNDYRHAENQQVVPVIVHEFSPASAEMPILFVKNSETGEFQSVAMLGLKPGENVFYQLGKWRGRYVPAIITHHPFALVPSQNDETQLQVVIKEDSHLVSDQEGESLFDALGNETEYMTKRKNAIGRYYENSQITRSFIDKISGLGLLKEKSLTLDLNGEKVALNGVYMVDEKALNQLSDADFLSLREKGFLAPIYCHLNSTHQLANIAALKTK
ncbi:SapC family protein [Thalassotalea sp. G2M2-11]|uniref:SapC family protein n=1 Tax=Thalassotalea sp. G2M2-11 TaxID=2787627 RepID=UPI0019D0D4C9|nr:SapC family protein [Thalassotalea sp. G2M2-11]